MEQILTNRARWALFVSKDGNFSAVKKRGYKLGWADRDRCLAVPYWFVSMPFSLFNVFFLSDSFLSLYFLSRAFVRFFGRCGLDDEWEARDLSMRPCRLGKVGLEWEKGRGRCGQRTKWRAHPWRVQFDVPCKGTAPIPMNFVFFIFSNF